MNQNDQEKFFQSVGKEVIDEGNAIQQKTGQRWNRQSWEAFAVSRVSTNQKKAEERQLQERASKEAFHVEGSKKDRELAYRIDHASKGETYEKRLQEAREQAVKDTEARDAIDELNRQERGSQTVEEFQQEMKTRFQKTQEVLSNIYE